MMPRFFSLVSSLRGASQGQNGGKQFHQEGFRTVGAGIGLTTPGPMLSDEADFDADDDEAGEEEACAKAEWGCARGKILGAFCLRGIRGPNKGGITGGG